MEALLKAGLCKSIGVSNFLIHHLDELQASSSIVPAINQVEFSPFWYRKELLEYCRAHGIQLESYSPLTRGEKFSHPTLRALSEKYHKTPAQILIRWALKHQVVVIPKSIHPERIREDANVFDFSLTPDDMAALDGLNEDYSIADPAWSRQFEVDRFVPPQSMKSLRT